MTRRKRRFRAQRRSPPGASPGTLVADPSALGTLVNLIGYGDEEIVERQGVSIDDIRSIKGEFPALWINVEGLGNIELVQQLGELFGMHPLALEDVVSGHQRPKTEEYEDHIFIVAAMVIPERGADTEQLSIFIGDGFVVTFQERHGDCFEAVRERLRRHRGRIRKSGTDYLAYALLDSIIDAFFPVLEDYGERLEALENAVVFQPEKELVEQVHAMKIDLLNLRRAIWPHREMISALIRDETELIGDQTRIYLRDCYDHTYQLMDLVETYREIASGLVDVYLSSMSARLNDIMKVLTIIATIFIPLGFIASVYGMNFDRAVSPWNMPELGWYYGYPLALLLMLVTAAALVVYFVREGWIELFWRRSRRRRKD